MTRIADEAEEEAERLNRARRGGSGLVKAVAVTTAAVVLGMLLAELFKDK